MVPPHSQKGTFALDYSSAGDLPEFAQTEMEPQAVARPRFIDSLDFLTALVLFVFTLPILALSLLWVVLVDRGNPFFTQTRIGLHGKPYTIFKVRSMRDDRRGHARFCAHGDDRLLPGGQFLRKTRIDELPQLFNVLIGNMALVGPRPEQPDFVKSFIKEIPRYAERFEVKPGITGLAQVSQGYVDSLHGTRIKVRYDLFFINKRSVALWLRIVARTIHVVVFGKGAR